MAAAHGVMTARPLRLLYILDSFPDPHAGTERQFWLLLRSLDRASVEPAVLLLRPSEFLQQNLEDAPVRVLGVHSVLRPGALWRILRAAWWARREGFQVAHIFFNDSAIVFPIVLRLLGIRVIVSRRDLGFWYTPGLLRLLRLNAPAISAVIANSEAVKREVVRHESIPEDRVHVIYNGLTRQLPEQGADARVQLQIPPDARVLAVVANLRPLKRMDDAIRALAIVVREVPEAWLVLVGEDRPDADGRSRRDVLERLAAELGVAARVRFTGKLRDPMPVILAAEIGLLCSETEGLSNAIIEYMMAGRPVVCTDAGGNGELVEDGRTGYVVPIGAPEAIAQRVLQLMQDASLRAAFGEAGRARARLLFDPDLMLKRHVSLYRLLAARTTGQAGEPLCRF